jgi:hypothetical protein
VGFAPISEGVTARTAITHENRPRYLPRRVARSGDSYRLRRRAPRLPQHARAAADSTRPEARYVNEARSLPLGSPAPVSRLHDVAPRRAPVDALRAVRSRLATRDRDQPQHLPCEGLAARPLPRRASLLLASAGLGRPCSSPRAKGSPGSSHLVGQGMSITPQHQPGIGVPEQSGYGVRGKARREQVRGKGVAAVVEAGEGRRNASSGAGPLKGPVSGHRA